MKIKKANTTKETAIHNSVPLFDKQNLVWMLAGALVMVIGFLLMAGGRSEDPNVFKPEEVYSTTRITVAPILILAGLVVLVIAIFRQPRNR